MITGLLTKSGEAKQANENANIEEQIKLAYSEWQIAKLTGSTENAKDFIKNRLDSSIGDVEDVLADDNTVTVTINKNEKERIYLFNSKNGTVKQVETALNSKEKKDSYVGCYADIDNDGTVDGVIFADLLTGSIRNTQGWGWTMMGTYSLSNDVNETNVKKYYKSTENYTDKYFGSHPIIFPNNSNGKERFYIISLKDFATSEYTTFYWYKNAYNKMSVDTSGDFGKGITNTSTIIDKWNLNGQEGGYVGATQDNQDIWKHIQQHSKSGWFIPSNAEWAACLNELGITKDNYNETYGLSGSYWTSSQYNSSIATHVSFGNNGIQRPIYKYFGCKCPSC